MPSDFTLEPYEWDRFSLPHGLCLAGENQHLIGGGSICVATTLRLIVDADEAPGEFSLRFGRGVDSEEGWEPADEEHAACFAAGWERALAEQMALAPEDLDGVSIRINMGALATVCPPEVLLSSPGVAVALTVAAGALRGSRSTVTDEDIIGNACRLRGALAGGGPVAGPASYGQATLGVLGGASYVVPDGDRLNVQQMLPPESLVLAVAGGARPGGFSSQEFAALSAALQALAEAGGGGLEHGDDGFERLFELGRGRLDEQQMTMVYGLLRVRQMVEEFLEYAGEPIVDNDRLAELCDEESAILTDYFAFPASLYAPVIEAAREEGALGAKLTWAFGGCPAAVLIAPGLRDDMARELAARFGEVNFMPVDVDPVGLVPGDIEPDRMREP
jgi:hypothetical protein